MCPSHGNYNLERISIISSLNLGWFHNRKKKIRGYPPKSKKFKILF